MAFWIKIFFGVCRIVIGGRFSAAGHERGGSSCSLCSIFCETENLQLQISPLSHLARTADAAPGTLQPIWLGLPALRRCGCGVETADKDRNLRGEYFCTRSMQLSLSGLQQ